MSHQNRHSSENSKKLPDVKTEELSGFDEGMKLEKIAGFFIHEGNIFWNVKYVDCERIDVVKDEEMKIKAGNERNIFLVNALMSSRGNEVSVSSKSLEKVLDDYLEEFEKQVAGFVRGMKVESIIDFVKKERNYFWIVKLVGCDEVRYVSTDQLESIMDNKAKHFARQFLVKYLEKRNYNKGLS